MPRLLDLFCGAGGASAGYVQAGWEVTGVDIEPQPHYPFRFVQADALTFPLDGYDAIHASPPCKRFSRLSSLHNGGLDHPDLITPIRARLQAAGVPWVIENVPGAPVQPDVLLCGTMFRLTFKGRELRRHRLFELSGFWALTPGCQHQWQALSVYGKGGTNDYDSQRRGVQADLAGASAIMGINWMTIREIGQAIPPAYTRHLGRALIGQLSVAADHDSGPGAAASEQGGQQHQAAP